MTTPDFVQVPPDVPGGKPVDTVRVTTTAATVERQVIVVADPTDPAGYVAVMATAPTGTEHGLVVRQVGSSAVTVATLPLPAGAATDATLTSGAVRVGGTVAITAAALPLPAGAATDTSVQAVTTAVTAQGTQAHADAGTAHTDSAALLTSLGSDGATPPTIAGTGVRGWLRALYDFFTTDVVDVNIVQDGEIDIFGASLIGERVNQVEVHFDDTNWKTYGTETTSPGGPTGGSSTQANGRVAFSSGTATNGAYRFISLDVAKYRPLHGVYGACTAAFVTPPTNAADRAWVWLLGDPTSGNGVAVGYKGTAFGLTYWRGGVEQVFVPLASWLLAPTRTHPGYTLNGVLQTFDPSKGQIYHVQCGLLGYAGFTVSVFSPDFEWVHVYTHEHLNNDAEPVFTNNDLYQYVDIAKTTSNATNITIQSACWGAGTTATVGRLSDPISDRSLVANVQSVIVGKTTAGGGAYVAAKVAPSGALVIQDTSAGTPGAAVPATASFVGGTDGTNLTPFSIDAKGAQVRDDYLTQVPLGDLAGAGAVLTFTFATPVDCAWVTDIGATATNISRVVINGTASSTSGHVLQNGTPFPFLMRNISTVSVYALVGSTISVCGYRR